MKSKTHYIPRCLAVLTALALSSTVASAALWTLDASLTGAAETPPNGSPASGFVELTLDDATGAVTITSGSFAGLVGGPATAAHIHGLAPPGVAAPVLIPLAITPAPSGTISGGGVLTAPNVAGMLSGLTYVNVHDGAFPGGEIRGQLTVVPEPGTLALAGLGAVGIALRVWGRRRASRS